MSRYPVAHSNFKPIVVHLILEKRTEEALELLAKEYHVDIPTIEVGLPKGHSRNSYGTYSASNRTISVMDSELFGNPFIILHEFDHHLRSQGVDKMHRGTEKNADRFAVDYLRAYNDAVKAAQKKSSS